MPAGSSVPTLKEAPNSLLVNALGFDTSHRMGPSVLLHLASASRSQNNPQVQTTPADRNVGL